MKPGAGAATLASGGYTLTRYQKHRNRAGPRDPHDCRHTFVSRLVENPGVSEQTVRALSGHVSKRMLEHYSHIRTSAKQAAIAVLDSAAEASEAALDEGNFSRGRAQRWAQSETRCDRPDAQSSKKILN